MSAQKDTLEQMGTVERELLGRSVYKDLQEHFKDPENQRRFKEWMKSREKTAQKEVK